ncbi:acyl-CoA thioesterase [Kitasatospora cathayae]|uniref:Thioesterase family protein n=1 Tax=Kitasatospora cathayae TaxID=3004092 RepID=A0ABY7PZT5_9ACTN|nr:acyl-CoA thioesterase domain-containing protein [Kitasatospora sp. HUAS 3-15]WBP85850.1 thioesterase family protein [Kitasatospora sp. HUAS 3-15]
MTDLTEQQRTIEQVPGPAARFAELLEIEQLDENTFRGRCHAGAPMRAFGGHVAAQALAAAGRTCAGTRAVHSLHGYFTLPGEPTRSIDYQVERLREGFTYATRQVRAVQGQKEIFNLTASFKLPEPDSGDRHREMPPLPGPETLPDAFSHWDEEQRTAIRSSDGFRDLELRFVPPDAPGVPSAVPGMPQQFVWLRIASPLPDTDPLLHTCALTYLSDLTLASTAGLHEQPNFFQRLEPPRLLMASLDHAMWFHRPFRADEWLLFAQRSPSASDGRGLSLGEFYDREGRLVASAVQEALIRRLT